MMGTPDKPRAQQCYTAHTRLGHKQTAKNNP